MSITEGTQPVAKTWTGAWTSGTPQTTAAFVPESGALLVALVSGDTPASGTIGTASITDSLSGTWTMLRRQNTQAGGVVGGTAEVWIRDSPNTSMTVTATQATGTAANGGQLTVRTLIGALATASQTGAVNGITTNSAAVQVSVTAGTGNKIYGAALNWTASTAMTVLANTTAITAVVDATNGDNWAAFKSSGDTAGTATYGYSTSTQAQFAAVEILASAAAAAPVPDLAMGPRTGA